MDSSTFIIIGLLLLIYSELINKIVPFLVHNKVSIIDKVLYIFYAILGITLIFIGMF